MAGRKSALILDTARQLFLERGYDATSLDDVAAASGVSFWSLGQENEFTRAAVAVAFSGPM